MSAPHFDLGLALFLIAALSDLADGAFARRFGVTKLGAVLDPLADKALVLATLAGLFVAAKLSPLAITAFAVIALRELVVAFWRIGRALPASRAAKLKTALQMSAIALLLAGLAFPSMKEIGTPAGDVLLALAAILSLYSAIAYFTPRKPKGARARPSRSRPAASW